MKDKRYKGRDPSDPVPFPCALPPGIKTPEGKIYWLASSALRSATTSSALTPCMVEPKLIDSMRIPGQVKQPLPKYFSITSAPPGSLSTMSPIMVSPSTSVISVISPPSCFFVPGSVLSPGFVCLLCFLIVPATSLVNHERPQRDM